MSALPEQIYADVTQLAVRNAQRFLKRRGVAPLTRAELRGALLETRKGLQRERALLADAPPPVRRHLLAELVTYNLARAVEARDANTRRQ